MPTKLSGDTIFIFFSARERTEFIKPCNLIGSWSGQNFLGGPLQRVESIELIYFRELISGYRQLFAFFHFHRRLIHASLSLFTFRWQEELL